MANQREQYPGQISNVSAVYNIYRIVLPLILLITYVGNSESSVLGIVNGDLFVWSNIGYSLFAILMGVFAPRGKHVARFPKILITALLIDSFAIGLIVYSCGGTISGLALLFLVTVSAASILLRGRISTFIAAVAALITIYIEVYLSFLLENPPNQFIQSGILGAVLFGISFYIQSVSERFYQATELADRRASDIIDLEKLNEEIIQRLRTGIVVVDANGWVVSMNSSARSQLSPILENVMSGGEEKTPLPSLLKYQLQVWQSNPSRQPRPITLPDSGKQFQINFAFLNPEAHSSILIFLEDNRQIVQRAQQGKLASLGRLTASIAHEIRNPLGAISHASQLLKESDNLDEPDQRMLEIILEHCDRVNLIIEDVLDASRHRETNPEKIVLGNWLETFIANYIESFQERPAIELSVVPHNTEINVIPSQLEQVLNNLFENGLRYSKQQTGTAHLSIEAGAQIVLGDYQPYIHIIDDGAGISATAEAQLFEPFHTTEASGTGLGLYISKELCEANQAQLVYRRTEVGQSCFSIYFSHPERSVA